MLAPIILPLQLTLLLFAAITVVVVSRGKSGEKRVQRFLVCFFAGIILFVPVLFGVGYLVDSVRYGEFHYADGSKIRDRKYIELPRKATDITVHKYASGHEARFTVSEADLKSWLDEYWRTHPWVRKPEVRDNEPEAQPMSAEEFARQFGRHNWEFMSDLKRYPGPTSARGGGFTLWHSPSRNVAYLAAGYW
jgi:hypothetical protein